MKVIKQFICLLVCFVLLSSSFMVGYATEGEFIPVFNSVEEFETALLFSLDPYAAAPLADIVAVYDWVGSDEFYISDAMLHNDKFLFYEDLPYGTDTVVIGFHFGGSSSSFIFLNGADFVPPAYTQTWHASGRGSFTCVSISPIYRIAYNVNSGDTVALDGVSGLSKTNNVDVVIGDDVYYGYSMILGNADYYVTFSNNYHLVESSVKLNGEVDDAIFGVDTFPTRANLSQQLQQEQNETSKSIWETLKSVLDYIKNLPSNIANSIQSFFTNLGDRISNFFTNLGDRISSFFTTLKNYLLYFQAEELADTDYGSVDFLSYLTDYISELSINLENFTGSLDSSFKSIESYISSGSSIINKLLNGVPVLNAVLIFFLAFAVIRKAVGR